MTLLQRWLKDHPGETEVPKKVKTNLANIKSVLRKKGRTAGRRSAAPAAGTESISAHGFAASKTRGVKGVKGLEQLEEQIDVDPCRPEHLSRIHAGRDARGRGEG